MIKYLLILALVSSQSILFAQEDVKSKLDSIMALQEEAWNQGDIEGFMQAYWKSDSLVFRTPKGVKYGWQATLEGYKRSYPNKESMGTLKFENTDFKSTTIDNESVAFIAGKWRLERETDTLGGIYILYWKKIKGEWKIISDSTTSD